jgi:glycosyltransferase involved in cell wall biosynthesis
MKTKVAYITSGVNGIHRFTFNELCLLKEKGVDFNLCLTQLKKGPCMPEADWVSYTASKSKAIKQFASLVFSNRKVLAYFFEAYKKGVYAYFLMAMSLYKDIKNNNISSLHCQMGDDKLYIGYYLKKIMNVPLTVTVHAHELYMRKVYEKNDEVVELFSACDTVFTISDFNREIIKEKFGVDKDRIQVMRLFPDIDYMGLVKNKIKILTVGNWWRKKGFEFLLKAIDKINRDDFVLWVVGSSYNTPDSIDVDQLVKDLKLESKVAVLGPQSSPVLDILFESCNIFCLPSYTEFHPDGNPSAREGIPVALMEAMAWGKPVVATKHAGNPELIKDFLVEERSVEELVEKLTFLMQNRDSWNEYGKRNQEIISQKYSKSNIDILANELVKISQQNN